MKDIFFQIKKVDEEKRLVTGQACAEVADRAGEIFDYETSKPLFEKWSQTIAEDTDGKSYGNVRSMHSNVAAGKVAEPLHFDDVNKAINITAKVVDDNEWEKVLEGVHTGFSIGGSYVNKWKDATDGELTRYTANPSEISLVDRPCIPTAKFFDVVKADGTVLRKAFQEKMMKTEQTVTVDQLTDEMAAMLKAGDLNEGDMLAAIKKALEEKRLDDLALGKKDYTDDERTAMAASGEAESDGSYPIKNAKDLSNAVQAYGRSKDPAKTKAHIKARAESLGLSDQLPDDWKDGGETAKVAKGDDAGTGSMSTEQPPQADNTAANAPGGRSESNATVMDLEKPKVGSMVQFTFGEASFQGKCTELGDDGSVTVSVDGSGEFTCASSKFTAAEPGSGVDFSMTGEMARKALSAAGLVKAGAVALRKGMYGVSSFASILASINYLQEDTEWEAAYEEDGSKLPDQLKAWMATGCDLLRAMVDEECRELVNDPDGDGMVDSYTLVMSAPTGDVGKSAYMAAAIAAKVSQGSGELKKFAAGLDLTKALQGKVEKLGGQVEKAATHAVELQKKLAEAGESLAKAVKERDEAVAKANKLEAERKAPAVMVVEKGDDVVTGSKEKDPVVTDAFGKVDDAASAFKKVHMTGGYQPKV